MGFEDGKTLAWEQFVDLDNDGFRISFTALSNELSFTIMATSFTYATLISGLEKSQASLGMGCAHI
jgi:hypothetical protein